MNSVLILELEKTPQGFTVLNNNNYIVADYAGDIQKNVNRGDYVITTGYHYNDFVILVYMINDIIKYNNKIVAVCKQEHIHVRGAWYDELPQCLTAAVNVAKELATSGEEV